MSVAELEKRVSELERKVAEVQELLEGHPPDKDWESTIGMFANRPGFREIVRSGRKYRDRQRKNESF